MSPADRKSLGKSGVTASEANAKHEARSEREIHRQIEQWLNLHGIVYIHSRMDRKTSTAKSIPDFCFCYFVKPLAIEIKLPGKLPTAEQRDCMERMRANGWTCAVARSLKEFIAIVTT